MVNLLLDVATGAQNPVPQKSPIILVFALVIGLAMIGYGIYTMLKNKRGDDMYLEDDAYDYDDSDPRDSQEQEDVAPTARQVPLVTKAPPVEKSSKKKSAPDIKISHSIKTNAYKMRDSIRCAHDIEDDLMDKNGYLVMMCDGIQGDEDTPSYITKRIMDEFYSNKRENESIQDFFENTVDKLDAEIVKFVSSGKSGTSLLACVIKNRELYLIGVGGARLYHIRANHAKLLTSEHRYKIDLANKVRVGEITEVEAKNDPRRDELISYIGVGGINYIDMNDVPIMLHDDDLLMFCSDGLYQSIDDEEIMDIVNNYDGEFKDCAKALTTAAMENADSAKDNDISALIIKIGE